MLLTTLRALALVACTLVHSSHSRKTAESGGGGTAGVTCQEVYFTMYKTGLVDKIGLDSGQDGDDGVTMVQTLFNGNGAPLLPTLLRHVPDLYAGSSTLVLTSGCS